jgi:hypothetical protein
MKIQHSNQQFTLIKGIISELQVRQSEEDFVVSNSDKAAGGAAAAGLAIGGLAGAATGALLSSGDTADKVSIFVCKVGNENVNGRFGEVTFSNGDEVEVVGERHGNNINAYAVAHPSHRTIWMHPHCGRGSKAFITMSIKWILLLSFLPPFMMGIIELWLSGQHAPLWFLLIIMPLSIGLVSGIVFFFVFTKFKKFSLLSSSIFNTLGFDKPDDIDLPQRQKLTLKNATNEERLAYHPHARWVYKY